MAFLSRISRFIGRFFGTKPPIPIDDALWQETLDTFPFLAALTPEESSRLRALTAVFLTEKEFSGAGGLDLSEAMCLCIAAQGCLPILELGISAYRGWSGIIVYPDEFVVSRQFEDESGVVHEFEDVLSGEAWPGGPLIVSWRDARSPGDGYNVVIHEFAHKLDMLNGEVDGVPLLHSGIRREEWEKTLLAAYDDFCDHLDQGEETRIDPYAGEDPAEFFAVLTESFFDIPHEVHSRYPDLYALLARYYRQDPLQRRYPFQKTVCQEGDSPLLCQDTQ